MKNTNDINRSSNDNSIRNEDNVYRREKYVYTDSNSLLLMYRMQMTVKLSCSEFHVYLG